MIARNLFSSNQAPINAMKRSLLKRGVVRCGNWRCWGNNLDDSMIGGMLYTRGFSRCPEFILVWKCKDCGTLFTTSPEGKVTSKPLPGGKQ